MVIPLHNRMSKLASWVDHELTLIVDDKRLLCLIDVEADVLVNLIGDEAPTLARASRLSAEFCRIVGPQLQTVRLVVSHRRR